MKMHSTGCPICGTKGNSVELYPANVTEEDFNPAIFSARRLPDRIHYAIVRCKTCGLVRSDPVLDAEELAQLYKKSAFNYGQEVECLRRTYGKYLARVDAENKGTLLEIGCGNGFMLKEALAQGYATVTGLEPSQECKEKSDMGDNILCDIMRPGLFQENTFDTICIFQTLDHVPNPLELLEECRRILRPRGRILILNHNASALSAKLLAERSPIYDVEHTYLYDVRTLQLLTKKAGMGTVKAGVAINTLSLHHLTYLFPFPKLIKEKLLSFLGHTSLGRVGISLPIGNLYLIAQKD